MDLFVPDDRDQYTDSQQIWIEEIRHDLQAGDAAEAGCDGT